MKRKIMICGASGVGKTTLANHMSELYNLPTFTTSASQLWDKYGFSSHADVLKKCMQSIGMGMGYQLEILENRQKEIGDRTEFVSDRSYVDNIVYLMLQNGSQLTEKMINPFLEVARKGLQEIDGIIFIRFTDQVFLENNNRRITNCYYQSMVDSVFDWVLTNYEIGLPTFGKLLELKMWDFETRIKVVDKWVNS